MCECDENERKSTEYFIFCHSLSMCESKHAEIFLNMIRFLKKDTRNYFFLNLQKQLKSKVKKVFKIIICGCLTLASQLFTLTSIWDFFSSFILDHDSSTCVFFSLIHRNSLTKIIKSFLFPNFINQNYMLKLNIF